MTEEILAPTKGWPIRRLYAFLMVDEQGEGICTSPFAGAWTPMIVRNSMAIEGLKRDAKHLSKITGKRIVLAEFKRSAKDLWTTTGEDAE